MVYKCILITVAVLICAHKCFDSPPSKRWNLILFPWVWAGLRTCLWWTDVVRDMTASFHQLLLTEGRLSKQFRWWRLSHWQEHGYPLLCHDEEDTLFSRCSSPKAFNFSPIRRKHYINANLWDILQNTWSVLFKSQGHTSKKKKKKKTEKLRDHQLNAEWILEEKKVISKTKTKTWRNLHKAYH